MPTIIRQDGFTIQIPTDDHAPAHVHCARGGAMFVVEIETLAIRQRRGAVKAQDIRDARRIVAEHTDTLLKNWRQLHG